MSSWRWPVFANLQNLYIHPVTLEPEFTGGWYSGLWALIGCTLCELSMKSDSLLECVILPGMTRKEKQDIK